MNKRKNQSIQSTFVKKPKKLIPIKIIGGHQYTKKWLVEWQDLTRTWEDYSSVKEMVVFREYIEHKIDIHTLAIEQTDNDDSDDSKKSPSYII